MKKTTDKKIFIIVIIFVFATSVANAGSLVRFLELGESGIKTELPSTPEDFAAEKAANSRVIFSIPKSVNRPTNDVVVYEMGNDGQFLAFKATPK